MTTYPPSPVPFRRAVRPCLATVLLCSLACPPAIALELQDGTGDALLQGMFNMMQQFSSSQGGKGAAGDPLGSAMQGMNTWNTMQNGASAMGMPSSGMGNSGMLSGAMQGMNTWNQLQGGGKGMGLPTSPGDMDMSSWGRQGMSLFGNASESGKGSSGAAPAVAKLQGGWRGAAGDVLLVRGDRIRIYANRRRFVEGRLAVRGDRLIIANPRTRMVLRYTYRQRGDVLNLRDSRGRILKYRRLLR